jgi:hypothetical protein
MTLALQEAIQAQELRHRMGNLANSVNQPRSRCLLPFRSIKKSMTRSVCALELAIVCSMHSSSWDEHPDSAVVKREPYVCALTHATAAGQLIFRSRGRGGHLQTLGNLQRDVPALQIAASDAHQISVMKEIADGAFMAKWRLIGASRGDAAQWALASVRRSSFVCCELFDVEY